jgi:hypothetical protein
MGPFQGEVSHSKVKAYLQWDFISIGVSQIMKRFLISFVLVSVLLSAGAFAGPSAKFAATYGNDGPYLVSAVFIDDAVADTGPIFDESAGFTFATIKVPQDKELLVGLSAEVGITTDTSIKGKKGGAARSIAGGSAWVVIFACPETVLNLHAPVR